MDKNFKTRVSVSVGMFAVAILALYTFDGALFKLLFALFTMISGIELMSFFKKRKGYTNTILALLELLFLIWGVIYVTHISVADFWYIILGVPGYDIFAYLFGKAFGGKIFKKSRPFPRISKNKTWEGTILGLTMAFLLVVILMSIRHDFIHWYFLFCGPLALMGDLFESFLKRKFNVKDSNEILIKKSHLFEKLELLVGGSVGHGGFLDRIDSTAFTCTILLIVSSLL